MVLLPLSPWITWLITSERQIWFTPEAATFDWVGDHLLGLSREVERGMTDNQGGS
jgi:hypothetical protein